MKVLGPWIFDRGGWYRIVREDDDNINVSFQITYDCVKKVYYFWESGILGWTRQYNDLGTAKQYIDKRIIEEEGYILIDDIEQWNKLMVLL